MEQVLGAYKILSQCDLEKGDGRDAKIKACRSLAEALPTLLHVSEFEKVLGACISSLLRIHADSDMALWAVAEESLWSVLRALVTQECERVMVELFKGVRGGEKEKVKRIALLRFADVCHLLPSARCRRFASALLPVVIQMIEEGGESLLEALATASPKLLDVFAFYMKEKEARDIVESCCQALKKGPSASCKRSLSDVCAAVCAIYPRPEWEFSIATLKPLIASADAAVMQGALMALSCLAREATSLWSRKRHRDPRSPLWPFGRDLLKTCNDCLRTPDAPMVWQAAAELGAKLFGALPMIELTDKELVDAVRESLLLLARNKTAGASRRAAAVQSLSAWGGYDVSEFLAEDDPLLRGSSLLACAKKGLAQESVVQGMKDSSSVVGRLAYESALELLQKLPFNVDMAKELLYNPPCEYWVVEKQRLLTIGKTNWLNAPFSLRQAVLANIIAALGNSDPRLRSAASEALAECAIYLLPDINVNPLSGDQETLVIEGAWRAVPYILRILMKEIRCYQHHHQLLGLHQAMCAVASTWCSPRRYLKREAARDMVDQQRPLHSGWPNPVQGCFSSYAARAVSQMISQPSNLLCALDHHIYVLKACTALARGGGASHSTSWPAVLLHCLRVCRLYDSSLDPLEVGDDSETLHGGGSAYVSLQNRLEALKPSSLPVESGDYYDLLKVSLKLIATLATDIGRPFASYGHLVLGVCKSVYSLVPSRCLDVCRAIAPLCFRPALSTPTTAVTSPGGPVQNTPVPASAAGKPFSGLCVPASLLYASGLGRPTPVTEDFPVSLNFPASHVEIALKMRPQLPSMLEPMVLKALELYPNEVSVKTRGKILGLVVTLIRCGVDFKRLDPKMSLVSCVQQQIIGKKAYLKDPTILLPSMYTFFGALISDDSSSVVDSTFLMQVATPVFGSPYWRSNARLVPSLRWLLRDLFVRRKIQLQKDPNAADPFKELRAHFVSCVVSKLPHEEAVEQLEALIRSVRPTQALVDEISLPTLRAIRALAASGKIVVWRQGQWTAWKTLIARVLPAQTSSLREAPATDALSAYATSYDPEDPDGVYVRVSEAFGKLVSMLVLQRLETSQDKSAMLEALQAAEACKYGEEIGKDLISTLRKEVDPTRAKRALFGGQSPPPVPKAVDERPKLDYRVNLIGPKLAVSQSVASKSNNLTTAAPLKSLLPLLSVEAVSADVEIPDELFPLPDALYRHAAKLQTLRVRLSRAELDQILLAAEGLAMTDPDRGPKTEKALECLRGAILRPASVVMLTTNNLCPQNDALRVTITPLWKREDEPMPDNALTVEPRGIFWRRGYVLEWSDEDDSLIGFVPLAIPSVFCTVELGNTGKAYGTICRLIRAGGTPSPAALTWVRQWMGFTKVAVMQQSMNAFLESLQSSASTTSMDIHEQVDQMLRSPSAQMYCLDAPKLLLGSSFTTAQAVSLLMSQIVRCLRLDLDLLPLAHILVKVLPNLKGDRGLHVYLMSLKVECDAGLFSSLVTLMGLCVLEPFRERDAHEVVHSLFLKDGSNMLEQLLQLMEEQGKEREEVENYRKEALTQLNIKG